MVHRSRIPFVNLRATAFFVLRNEMSLANDVALHAREQLPMRGVVRPRAMDTSDHVNHHEEVVNVRFPTFRWRAALQSAARAGVAR